MAWTAPLTASPNGTLTAANWNTHVRDNLLETLPGLLTTEGQYGVTDAANSLAVRRVSRASILTEQTSSSTSYTDLATTGPSVTATTGTACLVAIQTRFSNSGAGSTTITSYKVSGATTVAAADSYAIRGQGTANQVRAALHLHTGLTAGNNTFTMQYKVLSSTGTWANRRIYVLPL